METKRLVIVVVLSMALVLMWSYAAHFMRERHPEWYVQEAAPAATQPVEEQAVSAPAAVSPTTQEASRGGLEVVGAPAEAELVTLGHTAYDPQREARYPMGVRLSSRGAAVEAVTLNRFRQEVETEKPYTFQQPYEQAAAEFSRALATRTVKVNGVATNVATVNWNRVSATETSASYAIGIQGPAGQELLTVGKRYELLPADTPSKGYELVLTYSFRNPTDQPVEVQTVFNGPTVPPVEIAARDIPEVVAGYNDEGFVTLEHYPTSGFTPDQPAMNLESEEGFPLLWAGFINAYFDAIVRPEVVQGQRSSLANVTAQAVARRTEGQRETVGLSFETAEVTVQPGQEVTIPFRVYLGPRWREVLNSDYYAAFPLSYDKTLVLTGGLCGFCTFQWLINLLVWMLSGFHWIFGGFAGAGDWGLAIIALVIVVRLLLHPITKRSQISMSRMSKMGPEIERLKKKYGDNKDELNRAMMQFYKEQGVTPILGCLPMLLQMPIWIALWTSLQSTFELRHAPFLWGFTWIQDLAQPDRLITWEPISLYFFELSSLNLLPILLGLVFWLQQRMMPKPAATTPEQEQQQKMMQWMSLLFPLLLYTGPSGLNLYILTSTAIGIWESKRVRDHIEAQEEAERLGKVTVDAKATRAARRRGRGEPAEEPRRGGLAGWFSRLQEKAEEVRREAERRERGRR